jgi:hypothetical protein
MTITRREFGLRLAGVAGVPALLEITGCSTASTINTIITAAELGVSTLATVDPGLPGVALAAKYLDAVGAGVDCAITERQSTDPAAVQVSKIAACVSAAVLPVLPAGTPAVIGNILSKVAQAVANYIAGLTAVPGNGIPTAAASPITPAALKKLDGGDLSKLRSREVTMRQNCKKFWK